MVEFPAVLDSVLLLTQMPPYRGGGWGGWLQLYNFPLT